MRQFLNTGDERLHLWKNFRNDISELDLNRQLLEIAKFCSTLPRGARTLDYYNPINWPTPWEIFFYNSFCRNSISLIIFYTLVLINISETLELWVVKDNEGDYLLPVIGNKFILNYEPGMVSNYSEICDYFIVMQKFSQNQIKTIK